MDFETARQFVLKQTLDNRRRYARPFYAAASAGASAGAGAGYLSAAGSESHVLRA